MKQSIAQRNPMSLSISLLLAVLILLATSGPNRGLAQGRIQSSVMKINGPYFTLNNLTTAEGTNLDEAVIHGPATPPPGTELSRQPVSPLQLESAAAAKTLTVPAFAWSFGCSATSGSMIASFFDRNGYANMYTGPTNGGIMPLDSSSWPNWTDSYGATYAQCPLTASHNGLDGRATRGSIDDYWAKYSGGFQDPYITGGWPQHTWGDAIGDYMKTSQSAYSNDDGSTSFYSFTTAPVQLTCADMVTYGIDSYDGTYGRKLFYEARGYTVTDCYNQKTDNNGGGFTYAMYMAEIDAGRPVMINLAGHTVVGIGYNDAGSTVYIHDTWDYLTHSFTWGGSYSGMQLMSVSIVNLALNTPPGAFNKSAPANGATGVSTAPTLSWAASAGAATYEYCSDTTNNSACDGAWVTGLTTTSASLAGLANNTPYYWQVRARNAAGTTDANAGTWWSFTTQVALPAAFVKSGPGNGATGVSTALTLSWAASTGAATYEYCSDTTNNSACDGAWVTGLTTPSASLNGLANNTPYYWQVRARNAAGTTDANAGTWWSFTTQVALPAAFVKSGPANGATGVSTAPTLSWAASTGAATYEYCSDTTNNSACDGAWVTGLTTTNVSLAGLANNTPYYWQVRARNAAGTTDANAGTWWSFTTQVALPTAFVKTGPANGATGVSTAPTLSWAASTGAATYEYCYDMTNNSACDGAWVTGLTTTSASLAGLANNTPYYWQVRARNAAGTTDANAGTWWSFTTQVALPTAFVKSGPANSATGVSTAPTLSWAASTGAATYEYCFDTINNSACDGAWVTGLTTPSACLTGLANNTPYYWQVRARNAAGTTDANAGTWWSFTTAILPPAEFNKTGPANGVTVNTLNPTLGWEASSRADSYEYCFDTVDDALCSGSWLSTTDLQMTLPEQANGVTVYWQVRAVNLSGKTNADAETWWSFTIKRLSSLFLPVQKK